MTKRTKAVAIFVVVTLAMIMAVQTVPAAEYTVTENESEVRIATEQLEAAVRNRDDATSTTAAAAVTPLHSRSTASGRSGHGPAESPRHPRQMCIRSWW